MRKTVYDLGLLNKPAERVLPAGSKSLREQLRDKGIITDEIEIFRNPDPASLYEDAMKHEPLTCITHSGALAAVSGSKTGRSPQDKRITCDPSVKDDVWWGPINIKLSPDSFMINRDTAIDYLNTRKRLYVVDVYAGWDKAHQITVRIVSPRAYHALFMWNMLIRPTVEQLETDFNDPMYWIFNAGAFPANRHTQGNTSDCSVGISFEKREFYILGTQYAGEMKKGIFTIMHYLMPKAGVLSLHSSANEGAKGDVTLFFGLSGTGKTTLSADSKRLLIGDDEHCWSDNGIFNIEGGCYAKCIGLDKDAEPEIYNAIRFGTILENVVIDSVTREVDFNNTKLTENTRASYPIEFIPNAKIPCVGGHPSNIVFLTCDAFGVLPPVSRLTKEQAMYHFISGYTAKVAGTETGIVEPVATFSACFGQPFLVWHPARYAEMLAEKMDKFGTNCWLVNTGWIGGAYGEGSRIKISDSRAIVDAINDGALSKSEFKNFPVFNLQIPTTCPGVAPGVLDPSLGWRNIENYNISLRRLACLFVANFVQYSDQSSEAIKNAGPVIDD